MAMRLTKEAKLKKLQEKKQLLDDQIRQMEADHHRELRKVQDKRERLIGKAIYALIESGGWQQQQLLIMMDKFLKRPSDRALFELVPLDNPQDGKGQEKPSPEGQKPLNNSLGTSPTTPEKVPPALVEETSKVLSSKVNPASRLPVPDDKQNLLDEFNL
jgi:hypothetical protein